MFFSCPLVRARPEYQVRTRAGVNYFAPLARISSAMYSAVPTADVSPTVRIRFTRIDGCAPDDVGTA
jgi:hypothetical protein